MRKWLNFLRTVWIGLSTHKLRSILTILGIVIGVASVITMMSIGEGTQQTILSNIESMGTDLMTISPGSSVGPGGFRGGGMVQTLTLEDAEAIEAQVDGITAVAPYKSSNLQLIVGSENTNAQIIGTTTEYQQVQDLALTSGSFFTDFDYERGAKVAVIGDTIAETLFGTTDPVGQQMHMENIVVRVIGVLEGDDSFFNATGNSVIIPLTALRQAVALDRTAQGEYIVSSIYITLTDVEQVESVEEDITDLLRNRHRLSTGEDDDFNIQSVQEIAETMTETTETMTLLLGAIAAIALLVGGIGVMNIMLVSVLERTREIGIRKALGARETDIWSQFLFEAALLTFAGGIIGVICGWGISWILDFTDVYTTMVSPDIVILAVSVSIGIGLFFGFYPAWSASRLNPIEALRSE
ncbi:MAG: ABC transporter permease [Dehalococcoidia bacterium]